MQEHTTTLDRRKLGAVCSPMWGADWSATLADRLAMDARTVERFGLEKMPLDARRLALIAWKLLERNPQDPDAIRIATWAAKWAVRLIEAGGNPNRF